MPRYLVTGGAGFIGSHLVHELRSRGHEVRVVDNFDTGKRRNLEGIAGVEILEGDVVDRAVCVQAVRGVDYVLHEAAIASVPRSVADPLASHLANTDATLNLLVAARDAGVRRLVFAGSSAVYGNTATLPTGEDVAPDPLTPYALQKLAAEQYCRMFTRLYGLETVTTRYFNVFGPRQDPSSPYSGVISLFCSALLAGRQPTVFGDGEQTRDFTYVGDVVSAVLLAAETPAASGAVVNIATGQATSLNLLLRTMGSILGKKAEAQYKPARAGDIKKSEADISAATSLLGFRPTVSLEEGLRRTLDWFQSDSAAGSTSA